MWNEALSMSPDVSFASGASPTHGKAGLFVLEGLNSFGTTLYFYYVYFFAEKQFGFSKLQNLLLAAALGLTYGLSSIVGGKFAQRRGYFVALKAGYSIMAVMMSWGAFVQGLVLHLVIMFVSIFGMALTWPALEALTSENESRRGLQRCVGIYNLVWGGLGAVAYFCGGTIIEATEFRGMFFVPAAIHVVQLAGAIWIERTARKSHVTPCALAANCEEKRDYEHVRSPVSPQTFLRMAWLANPFGYLAINTVVAVMPALAQRLGLTVKEAGIICSIWLFVRTGSFLLLWLWPVWHYRFRWLVGAYIAMTVSFVVLLLGPSLVFVIAAQVVFGLALGLIYYSSLYYSMDAGDTKGEHGGFHEAMIGAGSFAGPAIGALTLFFLPRYPASSTWAVMALLTAGFAGLLWLRRRE
jgi:MFS family permease